MKEWFPCKPVPGGARKCFLSSTYGDINQEKCILIISRRWPVMSFVRVRGMGLTMLTRSSGALSTVANVCLHMTLILVVHGRLDRGPLLDKGTGVLSCTSSVTQRCRNCDIVSL
jgi:hypothetical protein